MIDFQLILILDIFTFLKFLLIYKEDRHVALPARSAVNTMWRMSTGVLAKAGSPVRGDPFPSLVSRHICTLGNPTATACTATDEGVADMIATILARGCVPKSWRG